MAPCTDNLKKSLPLSWLKSIVIHCNTMDQIHLSAKLSLKLSVQVAIRWLKILYKQTLKKNYHLVLVIINSSKVLGNELKTQLLK